MTEGGFTRISSRPRPRCTGGSPGFEHAPIAMQPPAANGWKPRHNPSPAEMRKLFEKAGFTVSNQHRIRRPAWTWIVSDLITVGIKS